MIHTLHKYKDAKEEDVTGICVSEVSEDGMSLPQGVVYEMTFPARCWLFMYQRMISHQLLLDIPTKPPSLCQQKQQIYQILWKFLQKQQIYQIMWKFLPLLPFFISSEHDPERFLILKWNFANFNPTCD